MLNVISHHIPDPDPVTIEGDSIHIYGPPEQDGAPDPGHPIIGGSNQMIVLPDQPCLVYDVGQANQPRPISPADSGIGCRIAAIVAPEQMVLPWLIAGLHDHAVILITVVNFVIFPTLRRGIVPPRYPAICCLQHLTDES